MDKLIKNLEHAHPLTLAEQVSYEAGKVVSLTLAQRPGVGMTLFAFDAGEGVSTDALIERLRQAVSDAAASTIKSSFFISVGFSLYFVPYCTSRIQSMPSCRLFSRVKSQ